RADILTSWGKIGCFVRQVGSLPAGACTEPGSGLSVGAVRRSAGGLTTRRRLTACPTKGRERLTGGGTGPSRGSRRLKGSSTVLLAMLAWGMHAEIVDRIAVSVGNRVITTSDLDRQIRVSAFLNGAKADQSAPARRAMAERMV